MAVADIVQWLDNAGLGQYAELFSAHAIDLEIVGDLTEQDLEKLGIPLGHRKKLLRAIGTLQAADGPVPPAVPLATGSQALSSHPTLPRTDPERRQLTIMFCDLVGSTELARHLDPEEYREVLRAYHAACTEAVARFDGFVAKYMGDGVLAYFGYPRAHEDDAGRAVRAGLGVIEHVSQLAVPSGLGPLHTRIGIATGLAVVGDLIGEGSAREQAVAGEVPNLAARLQALAAPGSVIIAEATRRLIAGEFDLEDLGPHTLKGFATPVPAWRVQSARSVESRFEARAGAAAPLVGRDEEISLLLRRWGQARDGEGQVVLLSGEPGIGKSRITQTLHERLAGEPHVRLRYQCSPYYVDSAFHPVVEQLERAAGFDRDDGPAARLGKLEALLAHSTNGGSEAVALIAAMLSLLTEERPPTTAYSPQKQKEKTIEVLVDHVVGLSRMQPVLCVFEDLHWTDPSTLEFLDRLIGRTAAERVLLLLTFRPEFTPPWRGQPHVTLVPLNRLARGQSTVLVETVIGGKALPAVVLEQIVTKTDGIPLFVEELTKTVLEAGLLREEDDRYELAGPLPPLAIPSTLHDSLMARLDRLLPVKEVAQVGACIGREFSYELLAAVGPLTDAQLKAALDRLVTSELLFQQGNPPKATYTFKHALVQDAAYESLLRSKRQQLHGRIAAALAQRWPETADSQPELLAHHYSVAGLIEPAIASWTKAAQLALRRSALAEAITHARRALTLTDRIPQGPQHRQRELEVQLLLSGALMAAKGWAAPEVGEAFARAHQLCELAATILQRRSVLYGMFGYHLVRGEYMHALKVARDELHLGLRANNNDAYVSGHFRIGHSLVQVGKLSAAHRHFERALIGGKAKEQGLRGEASITTDYRSTLLSFLAPDLLLLGLVEKARAANADALAEARRLAHPFPLVHALGYSLRLHCMLRDDAVVQEQAEDLAELSSRHGYGFYGAVATQWRGWLQARAGQTEEGIALLQKGIAAYQATGAKWTVPFTLGLLAQAHQVAGHAEEAVQILDEALRQVEQTGGRWIGAELLRLRADALLSLNQWEAAEYHLQKSLSLARGQKAKFWELRTATALARLWHRQDRVAEASCLLTPLYSWFGEGLGIRDVIEAKALLNELGGTPGEGATSAPAPTRATLLA